MVGSFLAACDPELMPTFPQHRLTRQKRKHEEKQEELLVNFYHYYLRNEFHFSDIYQSVNYIGSHAN